MRKIIAVTVVLIGAVALVQTSIAETSSPAYSITVLSGKAMASRFIETPHVTSFKCPTNSGLRKDVCAGTVSFEAWSAKDRGLESGRFVQTMMACRGPMTELRVQHKDRVILDVKFDCNYFGYELKKGSQRFDVRKFRSAVEAVAR